jgi:D-alanine-D-alanine ligase
MEADRLWIIKSLWEHASLGLDQSSLVRGSFHELAAILCTNAPRLGGACFAELFVEGREFNLSLLAGPEGPEVLPPAEIVFEGYGPQKAHIVDYCAKWNEFSFGYHHTCRRFDFPPQDQALIEELKEKADRCWQVFGLKGYGRIDFRVDDQGHLWILEINANPCLSPDAGFSAALSQAGLSFPDAVSRILNDALTSRKL